MNNKYFWDYNGLNYSDNKEWNQHDWNQTILVVLNDIVSKNYLELPIKLVISKELKELINDIDYINKTGIGNKYIITYEKLDDKNVILIINDFQVIKLFVDNYNKKSDNYTNDNYPQTHSIKKTIKICDVIINDYVIINSSKGFIYRLWNLILNPFRYLFNGQIKY